MSALASPWEGRRGFLRLALLGLLAWAVAFALDEVVERRLVAPVCAAHAAANGLTYRGVAVNGPRDDAPGARCLFGGSGADESSAAVQSLMPWLASLAIDFAVDMHFTLPLFMVLFWWLFRRSPTPSTPHGSLE